MPNHTTSSRAASSHAASSHPALARIARRGAALLAVAGCVGAGVLVAGSSAGASTDRPHDPVGSTRSIKAVHSGLLATGWAGDPDADGGNVRVMAVLDGRHIVASIKTSIRMPGITKSHDLGPTPGFSLTIPVPAGKHTVCVVVRDVGVGMDKVMKCVLVPLSRSLTATKIIRHSPHGAMTHGWASTKSVHFSGWATDPDYRARRSEVVLYLDGSSAATAVTTPYAWPRPAGAGPRSAFDFTVHESPGVYEGCLWVVNVGIGHNSFLGCKAVDTRAHETFANPAPSTIGAQVVTQAKKHIGQRYVWGAEGPKTFDCSGLVMYSYGKYGFTTPRVAMDQFHAARMIPASDAQPGDLVFYHDADGDVYHVGIYLSPGMTVAAIDPAEGVNYQQIWDPTWATYGTFSHN